MGYTILDHSADVAIQVEGVTAEEFYLSLFKGVYHLLVGKPMENSEQLYNKGLAFEELEIVGSGFDSEE
ncbi:MAG: archease, partial [bacterium]